MKNTFLIFLLSLLFSCKNSENQHSFGDPDVNSKTQKLSSSEADKDQQQNLDPKQNALDSTLPSLTKPMANIDWDKKIIKTATLKLEVKDFKTANTNIYSIVKQFGGYVAQEEQNLLEDKSETVVSIKVPVGQFETMMNELSKGDVKVMERKITSEDITAEMIDMKSRLEAKKQMRLKYLEFLKQSKNMEEVLRVQNELNNIQEEVEASTGRIDYLSHQSSFSTINLTFYQPLEGFAVDKSPSFLYKISDAFKSGTEWFVAFFILLVSIWPLLLIVGMIIFLIKKTKIRHTVGPQKTVS